MSRLPIFVLLFSLILIAGCGGSGTSSPGQNTITPPGASNTVAMTAGGGPAGLTNGLFTSVTVCSPGSTTNCATVGGILVDTGSFGLRILSQALPSGFTLPEQTDSGGNTIAECAVFADGFSWGPVATADMTIASEKASSMPTQIITGSFNGIPIPSSCQSAGMEEDTIATFGANGVLGVGNFAQDCGTACSTSSTPQIYFSCPTSGCFSTVEALTSQVVNPVALFATDNNGVIVELPAITSAAGESNVSGTLVFGIGTESNNGLGSATVLTLDQNGNFTTTFQGSPISGSFVDSGSTELFFTDSNLSTCVIGTPPNSSTFFCPSSTVSLSGTNQGANGSSINTPFTITNPNNITGAAANNLGAPDPSTIAGFDWGVPFFYGRNVFVAIAGASTPGGTGPYTAY